MLIFTVLTLHPVKKPYLRHILDNIETTDTKSSFPFGTDSRSCSATARNSMDLCYTSASRDLLRGAKPMIAALSVKMLVTVPYVLSPRIYPCCLALIGFAPLNSFCISTSMLEQKGTCSLTPRHTLTRKLTNTPNPRDYPVTTIMW